MGKKNKYQAKKSPMGGLTTKTELNDFIVLEGMMFVHATQLFNYIEARQAYDKWDEKESDALNKAKVAAFILLQNLKRVNPIRKKYFGSILNFDDEGLDRAENINKQIVRLYNATEEQHQIFDHASEMIMNNKLPMFLDWQYADLQEISKRSRYSVEAIRDILTWLYKYGEETVVKR